MHIEKKILRLVIVMFFLFIFSSTVFALKTYIIEHNSGKNEICALRQKANRLNPIYFEIDERNKEKERLLEAKFRNVKAWIDKKFFIGFDENFFGSKNLYLNWKDVPSTDEKEDFHPTLGYDIYKERTFFERIGPHSLK